MNFKDLQYSIGKFKADVHSQIAKKNPLQKQDTKALSTWISQERYDLASMKTVAYERSETVKALKDWIKEEAAEEKSENAQDLEDIVGNKLCYLLDKQIEIEQEFAAKYKQYRHAIKSIREREEKLSGQREKKRTLQSRIDNLVKTSPKSPRIMEFEKELNTLLKETQESEMDLADFKRFALKEAFYLRFNAMHEYGHKISLLAGFGKYLTDLIETKATTTEIRMPYEKSTEAQKIFEDAIKALKEWEPMAGDERPTLANYKLTSSSLTSISSELAIQPPQLPPRKPSYQKNTTADISSQTTTTTGDLKTDTEIEIDFAKIDLYDVPPPAYDASSSSSSPSSPSAPPQPSRYSYMDMLSHQGTHPSDLTSLTDSPIPMHRPLLPHHQDSLGSHSSVNYQQLYHQVNQHQQYHHYRPYAEFVQHHQHGPPTRVDAGGFRIPATYHHANAENEKEHLAHYYKQQEQQQQQQHPQNSQNNLHQHSLSQQVQSPNSYEEKIQENQDQ